MLSFECIENFSGKETLLSNQVLLSNDSVIRDSKFAGPARVGSTCALGPDSEFGRYFAVAERSSILRTKVGSFCTFGKNVSLNPFSHPTNWLSIHEFQYHRFAFDFVPEYRQFERLPRNAASVKSLSIGNDVWIGNNAIVMGGLTVADGAIIGAGAVVTRSVLPFEIVVGVPAQHLKFRFSKSIIKSLLELRWWDLEMEELSGLPFSNIEACIDLLEKLRVKKGA